MQMKWAGVTKVCQEQKKKMQKDLFQLDSLLLMTTERTNAQQCREASVQMAIDNNNFNRRECSVCDTA